MLYDERDSRLARNAVTLPEIVWKLKNSGGGVV